MKKYLFMIIVSFMCGCSTVKPLVLGSCKCNNLENYWDGIATIEEENDKIMANIPESCKIVASNENTESINSLLDALGLDKAKSTQKALNAYNDLKQCPEKFKNTSTLSHDIYGNLNNYFESKSKEYCPNGCRFGLILDLGTTSSNEFFKKYEERTANNPMNSYTLLQNAQKNIDKFDKSARMLQEYYYAKDEEIFKKRSGGKVVCHITISHFLSTNFDIRPDKNCIYGNDFSYYNSILSRNKDGVLVTGDYNAPLSFNKIIFVYTNEPYVNGAHLNGTLFTYAGLYEYTSVIGAFNTVNAFRPYSLGDKAKDLFFY
ncbi:MAG: hypothetical protein FWF35_04185 [Elusimicrobia bacterium]|nr:hypothetical protein [Elusimicrobiota bacterium]